MPIKMRKPSRINIQDGFLIFIFSEITSRIPRFAGTPMISERFR